MVQLVNSAMNSVCRTLIEDFSKDFLKKHKKYNSTSSCSTILNTSSTTTAILDHYESCCAVTNSNDKLLGDEFSNALSTKGINLPSSGSFKKIFSELSDRLHTGIVRTAESKIVVPNTISGVEKRFLIRFLIAKGESVAVLTHDGGFRDVLKSDYETPPSSPPTIDASSPPTNNKNKKRKKDKN